MTPESIKMIKQILINQTLIMEELKNNTSYPHIKEEMTSSIAASKKIVNSKINQ